MAKVLILMADYGHDPTETALPYHAFKNAGFTVHFATQHGAVPACDTKMLRGITQKLLGAKASTVAAYDVLSSSSEFTHPLSWSAPGFSFAPYDLVFFPGGHEKGVRQIIDCGVMKGLVGAYWEGTRRGGRKCLAAVCHGVMVLAGSEGVDGRSVLWECETTALPARFEQVAFWGTRWALGDYYKTYGAGSEDVEASVRKALANPDKQFKSSLSPAPFVVEDPQYNYISARFPGDVEVFSERVVKMVQRVLREGI